MVDTNRLSFDHYDFRRGWVDTKPGWHECSVDIPENFEKRKETCTEVIRWVYKNIDNCEVHARWIIMFGRFSFKFRYERDYNWFVLRWQ